MWCINTDRQEAAAAAAGAAPSGQTYETSVSGRRFRNQTESIRRDSQTQTFQPVVSKEQSVFIDSCSIRDSRPGVNKSLQFFWPVTATNEQMNPEYLFNTDSIGFDLNFFVSS